ncbi:Uncharacterised protein [Vibrio cholerae]|uniref:Uncharacterized protein n=1 Tax=Vibrio cholerae TaxID=666 RepID=A0A655TPF3_VIBCL|nr:Uncharacterised protein [Vibrio cholerae]CSB38263.1 Uncharacterised protein [Vibrio cholerae]CSB90040.1 Uncharacterised protein [Vibrio cholerae]CSC03481.1 Uncharacterised protein [Vibrio cholerae]
MQPNWARAFSQQCHIQSFKTLLTMSHRFRFFDQQIDMMVEC